MSAFGGKADIDFRHATMTLGGSGIAGIAACMSLIGEKRTGAVRSVIDGANNKLRTHLAQFFYEIFWK